MTNEERKRERLGELMPAAARIADETLRGKVIDVWLEAWERSGWDDVADCPSNPKLPGLPIIRQANCVAEMAVAVAGLIEASYDELSFDRDRLIAGGLLLDASKIVEMEPTGEAGAARFSALTKVMPHATYAAHMALNHGLADEIVNIILSHTKLTNTTPMTPEAVVLHYVDYMLADCMRMKRGAGLLMRGDISYG
ncbi:HD domain-containing protein, partial [Lutibaculum baratangense]|uniref:HD domain-containing protein n=1 Tax=Lutibaculum baratangense TaxID=1358440 RepID=UPI000590E6A0